MKTTLLVAAMLLAVVAAAPAQNCWYGGNSYRNDGGVTYIPQQGPPTFDQQFSGYLSNAWNDPMGWLERLLGLGGEGDTGGSYSGGIIGVDHMTGNGSNGRWRSHYK